MKTIVEKIDVAVYGLVVPFAVLHILPRYFLGLERAFGIRLVKHSLAQVVGSTLMTSGALLAIWCALLMYLHKRGSFSPFSKPTALVSIGPYRWVRHPMMWAINIVLVGEVLTFSSPLIFIWLLIWLRFSVVYIRQVEEPYLVSVFGDAYLEYCRKTPRWLPW